MKYLHPTLLLLYKHAKAQSPEISLSPSAENIDSTFQDLAEAQSACDREISCAGISSVSDGNNTQLYAHSFLPHPNDYTIYIGKIERGTVLSLGHEGMSVSQAEGFCSVHPNCVGFSYLDLDVVKDITFVSEVNSYVGDEVGDWKTHIVNDVGKAGHVNHTALKDRGYNIESYRSSRNFTIHSGRVQRGTVLSMGHDGMSVPEAKEYCQTHPNCVAFTYPVHSMNLIAPDNITFISDMNGYTYNEVGEWRTYISNDLNKANHVNETSIEYNDLPYPVCCTEKQIPTMCEIQAMDTLPRIPCNISRSEFYEKYEKTRTPVMLVGCDENWKAKKRWKIDTLLQRFSNDTKWRAEVEDDPDDSRDFVTWAEIKERRATGKWFYIFDNEFQSREENKQLEEDYEYPTPFQEADVYGHIKDFRSIDGWFRWFLMAPGGTGSYPHIDPQATDAWNSLITGHKWWVLYPEADFENPLELKCDAYCSDTISEKAWYTSIGINALRNECSNGQFPRHILQKPGETIYVPYPLYHSVFNMDDTTCVTANFGSPANLWSVWHEIVDDGEKHWRYAWNHVLDGEQRKQIREWGLWPVENIDMGYYKSIHNLDVGDDDDEEEDDSNDDADEEDDDEDVDEEFDIPAEVYNEE